MHDQILKSIKQGKPPTIIFTLMTLTNVLINLDHGILPACTNQLKKQFDMNQTQLGFLGSIVYLGIVLMGMFAGRLYQRINSKLLTLIALIALQVSLLLFILNDNKSLAYFCRFLTGVCQVFLLVYYPIWIDKFGYKKKTLWLTLLQICVPVGIFAGYGMTSLVINLGFTFKASFYLQIILVGIFIIAFGLLSKTKLDSRRKMSEEFDSSFINPGGSVKSPPVVVKEIQQSTLGDLQQTLKNSSVDNQKVQQHHTISYQLKKLWKSKMYFVGTMTMSIILFVSTGIQFWLTDYFINVLKFERQQVNIAYAVVSITGPTSGCGFGGYILSKRGGYQSPKAVYLVFTFSCIGIGSALFIPFMDGFYQCATALWLVLFFGGAMMPGLTGIMMASVPPYLRAFGNSTGEIIKNIFGYLPAPFIYGWFNYMVDDQRAGIKVIMFWGLWAPILLAIGSLYRFNQLKKLDLKKLMTSSTVKKHRKLSLSNLDTIQDPISPSNNLNIQSIITEQNTEIKQLDFQGQNKNQEQIKVCEQYIKHIQVQQQNAIISQYLAQQEVGLPSSQQLPDQIINKISSQSNISEENQIHVIGTNQQKSQKENNHSIMGKSKKQIQIIKIKQQTNNKEGYSQMIEQNYAIQCQQQSSINLNKEQQLNNSPEYLHQLTKEQNQNVQSYQL